VVGFIRPEGLVNAGGLDESSPYKEPADSSDPKQFAVGGGILGRRYHSYLKSPGGLDKSSPYEKIRNCSNF